MADRWIVAELNISTFAPTTNPKRRKMENDCINRRADCCWLTAHHHDRKLIVYPCAYLQHNCKECKDYKPKEKKTMNKIKITYKKAIKAHAAFTTQLQLLEKEFVFTGFSECEPHVDYVHNDIFLAWEDDKEGVIHELPIEEAIDEMRQNGCITPDLFAI